MSSWRVRVTQSTPELWPQQQLLTTLSPCRWAEGKGPLAVEFSGPEMKSLVRALFQNTERRAVALAKIK